MWPVLQIHFDDAEESLRRWHHCVETKESFEFV
jgi:hypothetical protein